jgi:hypothetical protein
MHLTRVTGPGRLAQLGPGSPTTDCSQWTVCARASSAAPAYTSVPSEGQSSPSSRLAVAEQLFMIEGCAPVGPVIDDDHFEGGRVSRTKPSTIASPPAFSGAARHSGHAGVP